ncbi:MAG: hypothetical protein IJ667_01885 [Synergistaceae bacterium]|nr:hypothetical protein [Synergistaceae bacterium]
MEIKFDAGNWKHPDGFVAEYMLDEFLDSTLYEEVICQKCSRFNEDEYAGCSNRLSPAWKECPLHKLYQAIKVAAEILEGTFYIINKSKPSDEIDDIDERVTMLFNEAGISYKHEKGEYMQ